MRKLLCLLITFLAGYKLGTMSVRPVVVSGYMPSRTIIQAKPVAPSQKLHVAAGLAGTMPNIDVGPILFADNNPWSDSRISFTTGSDNDIDFRVSLGNSNPNHTFRIDADGYWTIDGGSR
jgi:hypothetical protein